MLTNTTNSTDYIEKIEMDLLLEAVNRYYGYDFSNYSKAHIKRRLKVFQTKQRYASIFSLP